MDKRQIINAFNKKTGLRVGLSKDGGAWYVYGDDEDTAEIVSTLPETGIYVYALHHLSFENWIDELDRIFRPAIAEGLLTEKGVKKL